MIKESLVAEQTHRPSSLAPMPARFVPASGPEHEPPSEPNARPPSPSANMRAVRVLVVEDDPRLRATVADFLRGEGFQVDTAGHGLEALAGIERQAPDLMLLDMHLPLMDGWELAQ